jgi:hypothetical protein
VISPGLIRGENYGWGTVLVLYVGWARAETRIRVAPEGAYLLTVDVSAEAWAGRFAMDAARVQVTSPAGTFTATTDLLGIAIVPAAGDATLQVGKEGFNTIVRSLTVTSDQDVHFVLLP